MILSVCANPSVDSFWSIEKIEKATTNRSKGETFYPGGKGIHVAFALDEIGKEVTTLGVWGGFTGRWLRKKCHDTNITTIGPAVEKPNRLCITVSSQQDWNETELLGAGPEVTKKVVETFESDYNQNLSAVEAVTISGSTPTGFANDIYKKMVATAKEQNVPAFVDASGALLEQTLGAHPEAIHINRIEGKQLCGKNSPEEIARWLADYCNIAAVTAGPEGLYLANGDKIYHALYKIGEDNIYSTIGSGDCLLAGLCKAYLTYEKPKVWAKLAVACGSANCLHPKLGMLRNKDVEEIFEKIIIKQL